MTLRTLFLSTTLLITSMTSSTLAVDQDYGVSKSGAVKADTLMEEAVLSLDNVIAYAIKDNPELNSSARNVDLAIEDIDLAMADYRPDVMAMGEINHIQRDNDLSSEWESGTEKTASLSVEQPLYRGGQTSAAVARQESFKSASENRFFGDVQNKIVDVVFVYMATLTADQALKVNADNVNLLEEQLKATRARFEAGELTKTDVAQAEASLQQAKAEMAQSNAAYQVALSAFREETGLTDLAIELDYPEISEEELPESLDSALIMGMERNPDIIAANAIVRGFYEDVREKEGAFLPQITAGAGVTLSRDPAFSQLDRQETANMRVTASIPLYQGGVLRNQLRQSKIQKFQAKDDYEAVKRALTDEIISAWEEYRAVKVQIDAREAQLKASRLAYEGVKLEEQVGSRSILDVLDANQDVRDAELDLLQAKQDMVNAYYNLLGAVGLLDYSLWDKS